MLYSPEEDASRLVVALVARLITLVTGAFGTAVFDGVRDHPP